MFMLITEICFCIYFLNIIVVAWILWYELEGKPKVPALLKLELKVLTLSNSKPEVLSYDFKR